MPLTSLPAGEALAALKRNRLSRWPDGRQDRTRLDGVASVAMEPGFTLEPGEAIFTIGSCFARNIEARLAQAGFELPTLQLTLPREERASDTDNDLLNKYPPHSMLNELRWALEPGSDFPEAGFIEVRPDRWHDPHLAGNVAHAPLQRVRERRAMVQEVYRQAARCRVVVVTLGLAEAWFDQAVGVYLNGAPPAPAVTAEPGRFRLDVLTVAEIGEALDAMLALLKAHGRPDLRMLLTVSPVPFKATFTGRDAIVANTYSKSALRVAAEAFALSHDEVDYVPTYEIVTHTPRGAAYIQDNRHVTASVVSEIVDRVLQAYSPSPDLAAEEDPRPARQLNDLLKAGELEAALEIFARLAGRERYRNLGMTAAAFHLAYGKTLARSGQQAQAQVELAKAVALDEASASANYQLGIVLNKLQRPLEAQVYIRRAVELEPGSLEMRLRYVRQLAVNRDFAEALSQLRVAGQDRPDDPMVLDVQGELQEEMALAAPQAARLAQ